MNKHLAIASSSILAILSFPVACYTPNFVPAWLSAMVVFVAFIPIFLGLRSASVGQSFRLGYVFGFFSNAGIFFWIIIAMQKYGGLSVWTSGGVFLLLILVLALYPATTFWMMARLRDTAPPWLVGALVFTLLEWTRVHFPLEGFPWGTPAYALYGSLPLIQIGDVVGTTGLNLLVFSINFVLAEIIFSFRQKKCFPAVGLSIVAVLLVSTLVYGYIRISHFQSPPSSSKTIRVALLQGNIPQDLKWNAKASMSILGIYKRLTVKASASQPHLIVWPEAAMPMTVAANTQAFPFIGGLIKGADLVIGAATWSKEKDKTYFRNSAFVSSPTGRVRLRYDKQHLVPFGEYVPFSDVLPMHYIVPPVAGDFRKGFQPKLPSIAGSPYGILICYEVLFPDLAVDMVRRGAEFMVNITNDAWFDETSGPYQHVRFAAFRAIETRRPIVRAANTGFTTWFDPTGKMHKATKLFTNDLVLADVFPHRLQTFYVRYPYVVPHLTAWLLLASALGLFRKRNGRRPA